MSEIKQIPHELMPLCEGCPCLVFDPKVGKPCAAEIKKLRGMVEDRDKQIAMMYEEMGKWRR